MSCRNCSHWGKENRTFDERDNETLEVRTCSRFNLLTNEKETCDYDEGKDNPEDAVKYY